MKCVLLCGGFAKRLWPLTKNKPKPLLEVAGKPIIEYTLENLEKVSEVSEVFISTNKKFEKVFTDWLNQYRVSQVPISPINSSRDRVSALPCSRDVSASLCEERDADESPLKIKLIIEETRSEKEKLGSIGGFGFLVKKEGLNDDLLVINGDNIFEFSLKDFVGFFKEKHEAVVAFYDIKSLDAAKILGVGLLNNEAQLIDFAEKPAQPKSTLVSTGCYLFPKKLIPRIFEFLQSENPDATGLFIKWLLAREKIYGFKFEGKWFDIGSFEELEKAQEYFAGK